MTIEEVKQIVENSKFDPSLKQRLGLVLPSLGKYTLTGLGNEVSRGDSLIVADYLVSLWENFANLQEGLKKKDEESIQNLSKFLDKNLSKGNTDDRSYMLNFVLDVRSQADRGQAKITAQQYRQLLDFEIELYWQLPHDEILFLLHNHIVYLSQKINLLEDTKVAAYKNYWDYSIESSRIFSDALLKNTEVLGDKNPKKVGEWIQEYFNFRTTGSGPSDILLVAEFLTKSPLVQKLSPDERNSLSQILKLYVWIMEPDIDEAAVREYIEQKESAEAEEKERLLLGDDYDELQTSDNLQIQETVPVAVSASAGNFNLGSNIKPKNLIARPPTIPSPRPVNIQDILRKRDQGLEESNGLKMGSRNEASNSSQNGAQSDIDKKLEELKKRAGRKND